MIQDFKPELINAAYGDHISAANEDVLTLLSLSALIRVFWITFNLI